MPRKKKFDYVEWSFRREDEVTRKTLSQFKTELEFYEGSINLVFDIFDFLCGLTKSRSLSKGKSAVLLMLPRLIGTMQSTKILSLKGYYYDERILGRSFLENLGLCAHLARNPKDAKNWLEGKDVGIPKIKLYSEFASFLDEKREKYEKEGNDEYGKLSGYVHATLGAIGASYFTFKGHKSGKGRIDIRWPPFLNKEAVSPFALFPIATLLVLREIFKEELRDDLMNDLMNIAKEYATKIKSESPTVED